MDTTPARAPSTDPRFPSEQNRIDFSRFTFESIKPRYIGREFLSQNCQPTIQMINHYHLDKLVDCTTTVNQDLCAQFYHNLEKVDDRTYTTRVGGTDIQFTPSLLRTNLEIRESECTFLCYPSRPLPFGAPYSHITLDDIYMHFFFEERPLGLTEFRSTLLRVQDYTMYRVLTACILPLSSRDVSKM